MNGDDDPFEDDSSSSSEPFHKEGFEGLLAIKENDPSTTSFCADGDDTFIQNMPDEDWEELARDISNNTHLKDLELCEGALNNQKTSFLFQGLTRSSSIKCLKLHHNELSVAGVQSMVPFLQNASNLTELHLSRSNLQSEGFNVLLRALRHSPIEQLFCDRCGIESIEIDNEHIPGNLIRLSLCYNSISNDGCSQLAKLLRAGGATLEDLCLDDNDIDDDGLEILVDALQKNTSLSKLSLTKNDGMTNRGRIMLLKLLNDISSIKATLKSNHTLEYLYASWAAADNTQRFINNALLINRRHDSNPLAAGREKVIQTQLNSERREELCRRQEVDHSVYSEIDPLHLPEVLSLLGRRYHGRKELYIALKSSIAGLFSRVNMRQCIENQAAFRAAKIDEYQAKIDEYQAMIHEHGARLKELNARLETMDDSDQNKAEDIEVHNNKRRRI